MSSEILGPDLPVTYVPDHADRALAAMLFQDRAQPRIRALIQALGDGVQVVEDQIMDLSVGRVLSLATGVQLDRWGDLVGEPRGALLDVDFRRFIRARILVNVCNGTPDELIAIYELVMDAQRVCFTMPGAPAFFCLTAIRGSWLSTGLRRRVRRLMGDARPAGVAMELIEVLPGPFGFDDVLLPVLGLNAGVLAREV